MFTGSTLPAGGMECSARDGWPLGAAGAGRSRATRGSGVPIKAAVYRKSSLAAFQSGRSAVTNEASTLAGASSSPESSPRSTTRAPSLFFKASQNHARRRWGQVV